MTVPGPRLDSPHFEDEWVEVSREEVTLTDGRAVGEVMVARTPTGTVTRWAAEDPRDAYWRALSGALTGDLDPVDFEDVVLRHNEDSHIDGGTVRAVAPAGCKTVWGDSEDGCTPDAVRRALEPVLAGKLSCPLCGHDHLNHEDGRWGCPECERRVHP